MKPTQRHTSYFAFIVHRLSGLVLALFLPLHFLVLGLGLNHQSQLDELLLWSEQPLVKVAEWGLVVLLVIHLSFGVRILVLEYLPWVGQRKNLVWVGIIIAIATGTLFLFRAY